MDLTAAAATRPETLTESDSDIRPSSPVTPRRRSRVLAMLMTGALAVTSLGAVGAATAPEADAFTIGGCWAACPGEITIYDTPGDSTTGVQCTPGRLTISPSASAESGWYPGQYVAYRYYIQANNGYTFTSAWSGWTLAPASAVRLGSTVHTPRTALPVASFPVATGRSWTVKVQYAWYRGGTNYAYSGWVGPTSGYQWSGTQRWYTACYT
jgi:hypothetical protein